MAIYLSLQGMHHLLFLAEDSLELQDKALRDKCDHRCVETEHQGTKITLLILPA